MAKVNINFKSIVNQQERKIRNVIDTEGTCSKNTFKFAEQTAESNYSMTMTFLENAVKIYRIGKETQMQLLLFKEKIGICKYITLYGTMTMQAECTMYKKTGNSYVIKYQLFQNSNKIGNYEVYLKYEEKENG